MTKIDLENLSDEYVYNVFGVEGHESEALNDSYLNTLMLILKPEANLYARTFESDVHSIQFENGCLFDRLQRNDITQIKLFYADETAEEFDVVWEDADETGYTNRLQSSFLDDEGCICVQIVA